MNTWKLVVPLVAGVASIVFAGCTPAITVEAEVPVVETAPAAVRVRRAPPPEVVEDVPVAPASTMVWIRGHWHWNGADWVWARGHYERRRVGARWVPAHYENRPDGYVYVPGHWRR